LHRISRFTQNIFLTLVLVVLLLTSCVCQDSDSEASNGSVGLPKEETLEETEPGQGHGVRSRFASFPSPNIKKRPRACLAESGKMAARTTPTGGAIGSSPSSSVEKDDGRDAEDSNSSQARVQEEGAPHDKNLPIGWVRVKLEPDW
jgi:hypothetical protein